MKKLPFAEDLNYWKTSQTAPDSWIEKTKKLIQSFNGNIIAEAFGSEPGSGRSAFLLIFMMQNDQFKIVWPVLPSRSNNDRAAKIQAATLLFHDVKARLLNIQIFGARIAFFNYWQLPDGRTAAEATVPELSQGLPSLFNAQTMLEPGSEVIECDSV